MHIFVQDRRTPFPESETSALVLVDGVSIAARAFPRLVARFGWQLALRILARSALSNRLFFFSPAHGPIVCSGTLSIGFCKFYAVEKTTTVIGTIETTPADRGKGIATMTVKAAMNAMIRRGFTRFYIDTQPGNAPMLRSIEKLGFGPAKRITEA
jgi:RimJ/RimL family protein N-acetyltransferase